MIAVVQRVSNANVSINKELFAEIKKGILLLLGVFVDDTEKDLIYSVNKVINLRIFPNNRKNMELSIKEIGGEILLVSQFTLCGDIKKGRRPSFVNAANPSKGKKYYLKFINMLKQEWITVKTGQFGSNMQVELNNDGPVTVIIDSKQNSWSIILE